LIRAPRAKVWDVITDVERYAGRVPMLHKVRRDRDWVHVQLKLRVALFSVGFAFTAEVVREEGRSLELRWVDGEPRNLKLRFDLDDAPDGQTRVRAHIGFDVGSLGWLVKYFLRHHPEIQFGIFPGSALALVDSMRRAAEA
jgi:ribosome-associated toxin RatA of RatAB toxin-antitoxin module